MRVNKDFNPNSISDVLEGKEPSKFYVELFSYSLDEKCVGFGGNIGYITIHLCKELGLNTYLLTFCKIYEYNTYEGIYELKKEFRV